MRADACGVASSARKRRHSIDGNHRSGFRVDHWPPDYRVHQSTDPLFQSMLAAATLSTGSSPSTVEHACSKHFDIVLGPSFVSPSGHCMFCGRDSDSWRLLRATDAALSLSLANLCCLGAWSDLQGLAKPGNDYFRKLPLTGALTATIGKVLLLAVLFWAGIILVRRARTVHRTPPAARAFSLVMLRLVILSWFHWRRCS